MKNFTLPALEKMIERPEREPNKLMKISHAGDPDSIIGTA